ncbi:TOMM precursor leader peptide-binding protein [Streptomyces johnsoniae]|uniref:TOMM leader peptide-binding protein n=1 Tax=Streptomyces johnsoniae TaxID=3075532 RepID=A0ABU2S963_9ACTN|nr:TOMM precursor leader peptide-binding protein [Streptomyces sp. DSM 41886]MDT0444344.1 TOMM precursor leader peptide-binding protein [Streptomyces sp. DSM 41886]
MTTATPPLDAGCAQLQAELRTRWAAGGRPGPEPCVVPLGAADALARDGDPRAARRPSAGLHLSARAVLLGPWGGRAASAACGRCLAMRWQRLRTRSEREALEGTFAPRGAAAWPVLTAYAVDAVWAAHRAVLARAGRPPADGLPRVTRVDLATLALVTFPLLAEPLCPHCVTPRPDGADAALPVPASAAKPSPGTYRTRPAGAYPLPAQALVNPVCGVLGARTHLNPASTTTAPVSGSNFVRGYAGLNDVTWSGQADSYAASRTLAHLEGLERYAGTHARRGLLPVVGSYHALVRREGAAAVLDPAACGFYAPETYRDDPMVAPFDPDREIPWLRGWSLRAERPVLVPARLVHYSAGVRADNFVFECSNGCATGGSWTEAALFGLLELIERDAFLLAWYGRRPPVPLDLGAPADPRVRGMLDRAALLGYDVRAFDVRSDLAVPVVTGLAVRGDGGPGLLSFGAAAGLDPERAVADALSEVLTYIPHLPWQVAERRAELDAMAEDFGLVRQLQDHAQLYGLPRMAHHADGFLRAGPGRPLAEVFAGWERGRPRTSDLLDDLRLVVAELAAAGHDAIAVDQTTPEQRSFGLRTVATLAPGLLPLDFGWHRQRALRMPRLRRIAGAGARFTAAPHPFP